MDLRHTKNMNTKKEGYLVKYYGGDWGDSYETNIFVTFDEQVAIDYVKKFNRILQAYKDFYEKFDDNDELVGRYYTIERIDGAQYTKIEIRQYEKLQMGKNYDS